MKYIISIIITIIFLSSCFKVMDYDNSDYEPLLVLNGVIYQDSIFVVNVSRTLNMLVNEDSAEIFLDDANVSLFKDDEFLENLIYDSLGFYHSENIAETGHIYKITVEKEGFENAWGKIEFGDVFNPQISNLEYSISDTSIEYNADTPYIDFKEIKINFELDFNDNLNEKNYYSIKSMGYSDYISQGMICTNDSCWDYLEFAQRGYDNLYPWLNFDNNNMYEIIENYEEHYSIGRKGFTVIDDDFFNIYQQNLTYSVFYTALEVKPVDIFLYSLPKEFIKYSETNNLYNEVEYNSFAEPVNVYSNIENGAGFLVGITAKKFTFELQ
ncbi:MAG: DUF4249 family protein [Bacteroidales bacterium]|nr:DUF4249 family protein [Bacteroidales bacterium]